MNYEKFYNDVVAVVAKNHNDAADFANEILYLIRTAKNESLPNKSMHQTACAECGQPYPNHSHSCQQAGQA